jgi:hypothetical protein
VCQSARQPRARIDQFDESETIGKVMTFPPNLDILPASQGALWKELKATPKLFWGVTVGPLLLLGSGIAYRKISLSVRMRLLSRGIYRSVSLYLRDNKGKRDNKMQSQLDRALGT